MLSLSVVDAVIERTLLEDTNAGDLTTDATVPPEARATAVAVAKQGQVVCGSLVAERLFRRLDPAARFERLEAEGARVARGSRLWRVESFTRAILLGERSALNLVQRMGGVATATRRHVDALPAGSKTRIADTRKTTPGLRALERYAVRIGGGHNHRDNLGAAVLIKDNHILAAGGVENAIRRAQKSAPHTSRIEVEVEDLGMLEQALRAGADIVMLDNFPPADVSRAVALCIDRALVEVSGNVTLERIAELAGAGVDVISIGALTHSVTAADISLNIELDVV